MDNYRKISNKVYEVEKENVQINEKIKGTNHIVIDTIDTDKDTFGYEHEPRSNSMQAMTVAEIKDEYKSWDEDDLKDIKGYPQSVINQKSHHCLRWYQIMARLENQFSRNWL